MEAGLNKIDKMARFLCLFEELESSRDLIKYGFGHLQEIDMGNTFYHLPHQLMASGLERLMKCYILLVYDGRHGSYPDNTYVKHLGHNLQKLLQLVRTDFYGGTERAWVQRELNFITTDPVLQECIRILSLFWKKARYYNVRRAGSTPTMSSVSTTCWTPSISFFCPIVWIICRRLLG